MKLPLALLCLSLLALASPAPAPAQDRTLGPQYGNATLALGFSPDPASWPLMAGGGEAMLDVSDLRLIDAGRGNACGTFFIDAAPSFRLTLEGDDEAGSFRFLRLYADAPMGSRTDPALLVQQPDGSWRCIDDSHVGNYQGVMPILDLEDPGPGDYDIWVGSYLRNPAEPATLYVTAFRSNLPTPSGY